ncbi:hypothetical protein NDU88_002753 [Pleurodeles waltl]|uniref:Uncharacterized protein n=1 Tax=Pleurodeles waltl TaxID=8319 RepID=A0AAV7Q7L5_PLEWA|nr:hypothetical protein NDU88_002753 [Pleurodeles waltl]
MRRTCAAPGAYTKEEPAEQTRGPMPAGPHMVFGGKTWALAGPWVYNDREQSPWVVPGGVLAEACEAAYRATAPTRPSWMISQRERGQDGPIGPATKLQHAGCEAAVGLHT